MKILTSIAVSVALFAATGSAYAKCVEKSGYIICCGPFACHVFPK